MSEPTPTPDQVSGVGSMSSSDPIPPSRDMLRALSCALLVAASVMSPSTAPLLIPFVPVLVAIRLLRQRAGGRSFVVMATIMSLVAALGAAVQHGGFAAAAGAALLVVPLLGIVHARAALHDPIESPELVDWPEPRLRTGLTPTIGAWLVAVLVLVALALPAIEDPTSIGIDLVHEMYAPYVDSCSEGGAFESRDEFCERIADQRDWVDGIVEDHGPSLLAAIVALLAFGSAGTAHLLVLARARRSSARVRRSWRLRELEFHWSAAYVIAAGLVMVMVAGGGDSMAAVAARSVGVGLVTLGALVVVGQGVGLVAWMFARGRSPVWYRVVLAVFAVFVMQVTLVLLFFVGVLDMAIHPRRRAAKSGNVAGRGSGS